MIFEISELTSSLWMYVFIVDNLLINYWPELFIAKCQWLDNQWIIFVLFINCILVLSIKVAGTVYVNNISHLVVLFTVKFCGQYFVAEILAIYFTALFSNRMNILKKKFLSKMVFLFHCCTLLIWVEISASKVFKEYVP